jgi:hypothetical protein
MGFRRNLVAHISNQNLQYLVSQIGTFLRNRDFVQADTRRLASYVIKTIASKLIKTVNNELG